MFDTAGTGMGGSSTLPSTTATTGFTATNGVTTVGVTTVGVTTAAVTTGSSNTCMPGMFDGIGASCSTEGLSCNVPEGCCGVTAVCKNGIWEATQPLCGMVCLPCGSKGLECEINAVCVISSTETVTGTHDRCAANPCPSNNLSCGCAASVCDGEMCIGTMGSDVHCGCLNCGG